MWNGFTFSAFINAENPSPSPPGPAKRSIIENDLSNYDKIF